MFKIILSIIINWTCYSNSFWFEYWEIYGDYFIDYAYHRLLQEIN